MAKNYKKSEDQIKKELPKKGRNGDDVLAHLTKGEIVVPVEILDAEDGYLRKVINEIMTELGGNPNEYTVGHKDNKINPETGYPEFWGWNPFKAVKKVVKKVTNVVKKVVSKVATAVGLAPKMPAPTEAPSTGSSSYSASNQDSGNEQDAEVKKKSAALRRKRRGKRRLRINSGTEVGTTGSGSGVNAGSGSGVNVPKG
jgi:hypothetical protein